MTNLNKAIIGVLVLVVLNLGILNYSFFKNSKEELTLPAATNQVTNYVDQCGQECQAFVEERLASMAATWKLPTPKITSKPVSISIPVTPITTTTYVPIPGSGQSASLDWANVSGTDFYLNMGDYPGVTEVQFEATIRLLNGNGRVFVRLFDVTHGIAVQGSEASATSQSSTAVVASPVSFWSGNNLIRVQVKSLTADTAIYDGGRIKIISGN